MKTKVLVVGIFTLGMLALTLKPGEAHAKRRIVLINTGTDIFETGPLPEPYSSDPKLQNWKAGYECSIFGVFWIYMHWWDCHPVAYSANSFDGSPEMAETLGKTYTQDDMQVPPLQKYGRFGIAAVLLIIIGLWIAGRRKKDDDED